MLIKSNLDLDRNELINAVIDTQTTPPSAPFAGQVYFNMAPGADRLEVWNGSVWIPLYISTDNLTPNTAVLRDGSGNAKIATPSLATHIATKGYVDSVAGGTAHILGGIDCSANPNYPAAVIGDTYRITVAGKIGGLLGVTVNAGDEIICFVASLGGDQATVGSSWNVVESNRDQATTSLLGLVTFATDAEAIAKVATDKALTPSNLSSYPRKVVGYLGNNLTNSQQLTHNLGTKDIVATVYSVATGEVVIVDIEFTTDNIATITFGSIPSSNAYRITFIG